MDDFDAVFLSITCILVILLLGCLGYLSNAEKKRLLELSEATLKEKEYIVTVWNRASMSTSPEALRLLLRETFVYLCQFKDSDNILRLIEARYFIVGKISGLMKSSRILKLEKMKK